MADKLIATLNIPFSGKDGLGDEAGIHRIILRQASKRFNAVGALAVHCFPSSGVQFVASTGRVEPYSIRVWEAWEGLKFSNSEKASLQYPGATNVVLHTETSILMRKTKNLQGQTVIEPATGISLQWIPDEEIVVAQTSLGVRVPVYGACFVSYEALYQVLNYFPNTQETPVGGGNYSFAWTLGTLFGYNNYTVETLDLELDIKDPPEWVECARVTSKIVLDERGVWEYPENWDQTYQNNKNRMPDAKETFNQGTFAYFTNTYTIDPDASFTDIRVHCIVRVNTVGTLLYEEFNNGGDGYTWWNMPYQNSTGYHPKYELQFIDPPGGKKASSAEDFKHDVNNRTWRDVFLEIDTAEIRAKFKDEYPDIRDSSGNIIT